MQLYLALIYSQMLKQWSNNVLTSIYLTISNEAKIIDILKPIDFVSNPVPPVKNPIICRENLAKKL